MKNEPGLRMESGPFAFDFTPHGGVSLGNVELSARLGAGIRLGVHLPDDFGIQPIDSLATTSGGLSPSDRHRWGAYVFAGTEGRVVGHNTFLDGNLFHPSHSVDREPLVGDLSLGFVVVLNRFEIGYSHFFRTPEFHGQTQPDSFGSFSARIKF